MNIEEAAKEIIEYTVRLRDELCEKFGLRAYEWRRLPVDLAGPLEKIDEIANEVRRDADYAWRDITRR
ncbi:hypothetical protein SF83666_c28950 [Sinorhizobium fredii CCBAU 83666]|nr:hypothetical protein SF83666_c28950 [Sinorhizobium fredii CCBAU 83666]